MLHACTIIPPTPPTSPIDSALHNLRSDRVAWHTCVFLDEWMEKSFIIVLLLTLCRLPSHVCGFGSRAVFHRTLATTANPSTTGNRLATAADTRRSILSLAMKKGTKRKVPTPLAVTSTALKHTTNDKDSSKECLLEDWAYHNDASFHDFQPEESAEIRDSLLVWYRANRRKLPWRGDPPPYDGSTAGIATGNKDTKKKKKTMDDLKTQPSVKSFFGPASSSNGPTNSTSTTRTSKRKALAKNNASLPVVTIKEEHVASADTSGGALEVTAYGVWVSEIMLQQTRVEAVIPYYLKWMTRFPTVHHLADASEEDVNAHWAGLGFYRRARLLHKGAKYVVETYNGELPRTVPELLEIDGIGRYTASAVASIAFQVCVPVVDGNVCRVLSRLKGIANNIKANVFKDDIGWRLAEQIVASGDATHSGEVNQAMMELGATYCAPSGSGMDERDPLKQFYMSTRLGHAFATNISAPSSTCSPPFSVDKFLSKRNGYLNGDKGCRLCEADGVASVLKDLHNTFNTMGDQIEPLEAAKSGHSVFPRAPPKKAKREEVLAVATICRVASGTAEDQWLLVKRPKDGLLAGQWEFPSACVWTSADKDKGVRGKKKTASKSKVNAIELPIVDSDIRVSALNALLRKILVDSEGFPIHDWVHQCSRENVGASTLEHIFSHVRHTMWIEYGQLSECTDKEDYNVDAWVTTQGQEVRWMTTANMKTVGVTSGVKKILKRVNENRT